MAATDQANAIELKVELRAHLIAQLTPEQRAALAALLESMLQRNAGEHDQDSRYVPTVEGGWLVRS